MKTITLTGNQQMELEKLKKQYQAKHKVFRKLKCIELRSKGMKPKQVVELLDVGNDIICKWCNIFEEKGLQGLCETHYEGRRVSEFEQHKEEIKQMIHDKIYGSYKELYDAISKKYSITKKQDALWKFCKKIGIGVTKNAI